MKIERRLLARKYMYIYILLFLNIFDVFICLINILSSEFSFALPTS